MTKQKSNIVKSPIPTPPPVMRKLSMFVHYSGLREYVGTEYDMPPFDVPNGSKFSRMDGKTFWFDGAHKTWISPDGDVISEMHYEEGGGGTIVTPPSEGGKK